MGFDLYGEQARNKKGEYFRNNVWWWRPLWEYVCSVCFDILSERDAESGYYNDNHMIDAEKAALISNRLKTELLSGRTKQYEMKFTHETGYSFSEENVKEFLEFCESSGGFEIG